MKATTLCFICFAWTRTTKWQNDNLKWQQLAACRNHSDKDIFSHNNLQLLSILCSKIDNLPTVEWVSGKVSPNCCKFARYESVWSFIIFLPFVLDCIISIQVFRCFVNSTRVSHSFNSFISSRKKGLCWNNLEKQILFKTNLLVILHIPKGFLRINVDSTQI